MSNSNKPGPREDSSLSSSQQTRPIDLSRISTRIRDLDNKLDSGAIRIPNASQNTTNPQNPSATLRPTNIDEMNFNKTSPMMNRRQKGLNLPISPMPNRKSPFTESKYQEALARSGIFLIDNEEKSIRQEDIIRDCLLGYGTCGQVFKVQYQPTKTSFAVKLMPRTGSDEENKRIIMDLHVIRKSVESPYIVHCLGYFVNSSEVWIGMELMASCFDKILKSTKRPIPEAIIGKLTVAVITALKYLKDSHGIIHRDVKPSNILINEQGTIKLCDFGISGFLIDSKAKTQTAGCVAYMSPERIQPMDSANPSYDVRADVWSLGITLIELGTNRHPYGNLLNEFSVMANIVEQEPPQLPGDMEFSDDFRSFVSECLIKKEEERPKYGALLSKKFFVRSRDEPDNVAEWFSTVQSQLNDKNGTK